MENRKFCDERCMKFVGTKLGRKPKDGQKIMEQEKTEYKAVYDRIKIEGSLGVGKGGSTST